MNIKSIVLYILLSSMVTHTALAEEARNEVRQATSAFASFKRDIQCAFSRKGCTREQKRRLFKQGVALLGIIALVYAGVKYKIANRAQTPKELDEFLKRADEDHKKQEAEQKAEERRLTKEYEERKRKREQELAAKFEKEKRQIHEKFEKKRQEIIEEIEELEKEKTEKKETLARQLPNLEKQFEEFYQKTTSLNQQIKDLSNEIMQQTIEPDPSSFSAEKKEEIDAKTQQLSNLYNEKRKIIAELPNDLIPDLTDAIKEVRGQDALRDFRKKADNILFGGNLE